MYDPKVARFLQEDTYIGILDDPLSLNLYVYCANNPLIYYDPTGHFKIFGIEFGNPIDGVKTRIDSKKREEAFDIINEYGSESDKKIAVISASIGVAATGTAVIVTGAYVAPTVVPAVTEAVSSAVAGTYT